VAAVLAGSVILAQAPMFRDEGGAGHGGTLDLDPAGIGLLALAAAPLLAWRRAPLGVLALTAAASVGLAALDYRFGFPLGATVALYLLAAGRDQARPWTPPMTALVLTLLAAYLATTALAGGRFPWVELSHTGLAWTAAWFAGERTRLRRQEVAELAARAERAEREAEQDRQLAVAEERARIARDLHDSAGHAVNVIAVRAGAARLRHAADPRRSLAALEGIEDLARRTVVDIDGFVGALRQDRGDGHDRAQGQGGPDAPVEPPPGLASLEALLDQHRAAELEIGVETVGDPIELAAPTDQACFRILQEALTNASRHGAGSAHVRLGYTEGAVEVSVTNPVSPDRPGRQGGGHGLVGMEERAALAGGELAVWERGGRFGVRARLPAGPGIGRGVAS